MSTKIYDGFYVENQSIQELSDKVFGFFKKIRTVYEHKHKQLFFALMTSIVDSFDFKPNGESYKLGDEAEFKEGDLVPVKLDMYLSDCYRNIKKTMRRDPFVDFECEISFIPNKKNGKILGIIYAEKQEYKDLWFKTKGVFEYGYWNNVDKLENVSTKDWNKRGREWDRALPGFSTPAQKGFNFTFLGESIDWLSFKKEFSEDFEAYSKGFIASREKRAENIAKSILAIRYNIGYQFNLGRRFDMREGEWYDCHREFNEKLKSGEFDDIKNCLVAEILPKVRDIHPKIVL